MHADDVRSQALALVAAGVNDCEVARRLGIPRTTVRDWRRPRYEPRNGVPMRSVRCWRCWEPARPVWFDADDYAELLGLYLGDGHITHLARTSRLRIFLDARYELVVDDCEALLRRCFPDNSVARVIRHQGRMVVVYVHHAHLVCLFPQHGVGKKHERVIALEPWQREVVQSSPWSFLRGCIRSDGCVFVNRTGKYEYVSYEFANRSPGILGLFCEVCEHLGLRPRRYAKHARLYRREDVAELLAHVGTKRTAPTAAR
jgi:hypothetical protein